jgi:hypothetical protein
MKAQTIDRDVKPDNTWTYSLAPYRAILTYNGSWSAEYFKGEAANPFFSSDHYLHPNLELRLNQFVGADRVVRRVLRSFERGWSVTD